MDDDPRPSGRDFLAARRERRLALLASLVAVVAGSGTASGAGDRTPKSVVEQALLKVRPAPDLVKSERVRGNRVRVIMELNSPPLAAATYARSLGGLGVRQKLNLDTSFSRSYLSALEAEQSRAIADLHEAMPDAVVSRRYQVLVNGFAVSVPYARLPKLLDTGIAKKVYPSYSYHLNLDTGPSVVGAPQFSAAVGARGDGVKVAVVDSGVDAAHPRVRGVAGWVAFEVDEATPERYRVVVEPHEDLVGHGTACAAIIRTIAPDAEIHSVRVLGTNLKGRGTLLRAGRNATRAYRTHAARPRRAIRARGPARARSRRRRCRRGA